MKLPWIEAATKMLGTVEGAGPKDNPAVVALFTEAGHSEIHHDEVPWCAAFVGAMLKRGGVKNNGSLSARSYETWGQPTPKNEPVFGCVGVKHRSGANPPPGLGHVGFVVGMSADKSVVYMLGGNQGDRVSIASFKRSEFTAFRYPANIPFPSPPLPLPQSIVGAQSNVREA